MTQGLIIRRAGLADVSAIWAIEKAAFLTPWSRWSFLAELGQRYSHTLVIGPAAPHPRQTLGYLIFWVVLDEMHILNLAVHPKHRRRGLARRLLAEGLAQARTLGAELAWLEVRTSNLAAQALYKSFGFREVGRRPRYYDDTREDALLLTLDWSEAGKK
ncbi:MAG: ribosomal-protein-alanine N-acetyltransferase [Deltaproteobacteria bacterium]|nr:ribosomal-protein-alanine N-acetyltransferase [Deltaproteobacteria bacterium]